MPLAPLEKKVLETLVAGRLAERGQLGLVCVSGGGDSLAALHLLRALAPWLPLALEVLHFDHGLRPESAREARWVGRQAAELGLAFHLRTTTRLAAKKAGLQAAAREWRHRETLKLVRARGAAWAATGHQRDDQTETILLKLLRGCHLSQLRGMEARVGPFIRPLLDIPREALRGYLREKGVEWLEDPTNQESRYKRNRVRRELVPLMDELAGGQWARRLRRLELESRQLADLLAAHPQPPQNHPARPPHWVEVAGLLRLPPLARGEALHRFIQERHPGTLGAAQIERALQLAGGQNRVWRMNLAGRRTLKRLGAKLFLERPPARAQPPGVVVAEGRRIEAPRPLQVHLHLHEGACPESGGMALHNLPEKGRFLVRSRLPGDRFHPPWRERPVKLKDFLRDQRVPLSERDHCPLLVWENRVIAIYPKFAAHGFDRPAPDGQSFCLHLAGHLAGD